MDWTLADKVLKKTPLVFAKTFPDTIENGRMSDFY